MRGLPVVLLALAFALTGAATGCAANPGPGTAADAVAKGLTVTVPSIGVRSGLMPLGLNEDQTVATPPLSAVEQAGVYVNGPAPGDPGPAVILGHVNGGGRQGVFARLAQVRAGQVVDVTRADGSVAEFTVREVTRVPKDRFPTARVWSDTPGPELRLITCGGAPDRTGRSYVDNVVVYATLTSTRPA